MGQDRENGSAQLHSAVPPRNLQCAREHVSRTLGLCTMVTVVGGQTEVKYREVNKITVKEEIIKNVGICFNVTLNI